MEFPRRILIWAVFFTSGCLARISIRETNSIESRLVDVAVQIVKSCYPNRMTPVGLAGNSTEVITQILKSQESIPVTNIDSDARVVENSLGLSGHRYKLQVFVVTASSSTALMRILEHLKASLWWNHMAAFLILDWPPSTRSCFKAYDMLWVAWEMNILNANLVCHHRTKDRLIYTFNPYTNQAPQPWRVDKTYSGKNNHLWTLFVRSYEEGKRVCKGLDFEKTNDLSGYEIRTSILNFTSYYKVMEPVGLCLGPFSDIFCDIIIRGLNATPGLVVHNSTHDIGFDYGKGNVSGVLGEVALGLSDLAITSRYLTSMTNLTSTYPHMQGGASCITRYRGYKSQLSKLRSVIDSNSRTGLCFVCFVTILFFKFIRREPLTLALLSTLRMICNSALPRVPTRIGPRIYFGSLLMFVVTMQGIYQGKLASLLTHPQPLRNANTMQDLADLGHRIYGVPSMRVFFNDPEFEGRFTSVKAVNCTEYVLRSPTAACTGPPIALMKDAAKFNLHLSDNVLVPVYEALPIRPDWPLENKINQLILRAVEANRIQYVYENRTYETYQLLESQKNEYKDKKPKVMTFNQLKFAFVILAIGLGCATVSFVVEVAIG